MQAVLLAAGMSSRFYPYNQDLEQKAFVVMMGKTLLEHTIDALSSLEIKDIIIICKKNSTIPNLFASRTDLHISYIEQPESLGMGDALLRAKSHLQETFFVLSPYHMDIVEFAKDLQSLQVEDGHSVLVKKDDVLDRYGNVTLEGNIVRDVVEKPVKSEQTSYRIAAIYCLSKTIIPTLEELPTEHYHFEKALAIEAKKGKVKALVTEKPTVTLKYAWDLLGIKDYLLSRISSSTISEKASVASDVIMTGPVVIEEEAVVLEGACIKGPAYIGKHVTIGNKAIVRGGVIVEEHSVIGSQMEIKNTFVMHNTTTHSGFIGDSVVGHHTKIAAGVITANARLDRQTVSAIVKDEKVNTGLRHFGAIIGSNDNIGIRVALMPGVVIGNHVIVGPSTTVMKNIPNNVKYYTKFAEVIEEQNEK